MRELSNQFVQYTAETAWAQIKATANADIIGSWGISNLYAQEISVRTSEGDLHMAALVMQVDGFNTKGLVLVCLDEGQDLYRIYTAASENDELHEYSSGTYCDNLSETLDRLIERGDMTDDQYQQRVRSTYMAI